MYTRRGMKLTVGALWLRDVAPHTTYLVGEAMCFSPRILRP
jgi:hypothetical protein